MFRPPEDFGRPKSEVENVIKTFTEDRKEITPELSRAWENKTRLRGKAHARRIAAAGSTGLLVLWVAGMVTSCRLGGSIHILLVAAVAVLVGHSLWDRRSIL